jgi:hypothetical protein
MTVLELADVRERIEADGAEPVGGTSEAFGAHIAKEHTKMVEGGEVLRRLLLTATEKDESADSVLHGSLLLRGVSEPLRVDWSQNGIGNRWTS